MVRPGESPQSSKLTSFGKPGVPTGVTATAGDSKATVQWTAADSNGQAIAHYDVTWSGGHLTSTGTSLTATGLNNGTSYQFQVRACNNYCGDYSDPSAGTVPHGPPSAPGIAVGHPSATSVQFNWGAGNLNGCNTGPLNYRYSINGGGAVASGPNSASGAVGSGYNQPYSIVLTVTDACGEQATSAASASTDPPPAPSIDASQGAEYQPNGTRCTPTMCNWLTLQLHNFPVGPVSWTCHDSDYPNGYGSTYSTTVTDPNELLTTNTCFDSGDTAHTTFQVWAVFGGVTSSKATYTY